MKLSGEGKRYKKHLPTQSQIVVLCLDMARQVNGWVLPPNRRYRTVGKF